jgi:DNA repair exonuclease SbcCD ATPase subunit
MDDATRLMAIKAMDAADESWTINDPLADAAAKLQALAAHGQAITANLQQLEQQTQAHLDAVAQRQDKVVGDIRQQIAELEGLVARELNRSAQETATQQANLQAARDQIARDLAEVAQVSQRLQSLSSQFGAPNTIPKE